MSVYEFGPFQLDVERLLLSCGGAPMPLGPKVVETLLALLEHPGDVLTKSALLNRIWPEGFVEEANLAQNVYVLRKMLRTHWDVDSIETVPRRGYRFVTDVRLIEHVEPACVPVEVLAPVVAARAVQPKPRFSVMFAAAGFAIVLLGLGIGFGVAHRGAPPPLSPYAQRLYEIGRYDWNLRTRDGLEKSIAYFTSVIDADPHNARGYAALAQAYATLADYDYGPLPAKTYAARARRYAQKALSINDSNAEAYAALGLIALDANDLTNAQRQLERAIALDPNCGAAHEWYGLTLFANNRLQDAYDQLQIAADIDPLSVATTSWLGSTAYLDHRFGEAIAYARQALDLSPKRRQAYVTLGMAYEAEGAPAQAVAVYRRYQQLCPACRAEGAALLAHAFATMHRIDAARTELGYARAHANDVEPADMAAALAAVGDREIALGMLRKMHRAQMLIAVKNDPRFQSLRSAAE
jgi:DNA-binding winged helix-turn-helix (wHTH) protein/tetratricopeptide (TPR) repeat protein